MFLNPLGLLALLGIPAVIALHLFRRRFKPRRVSALFLWHAHSTTSSSGRRRENLLRSPSFWSELLLALLLALGFAGPRACGTLEAKHLVVVLDGSASMSAETPGADGSEESPAELVVEDVRATIDALPSGSRVTVIETGQETRILIGPAAFPEEAAGRLDDYRPWKGRHDLIPAISLALEIAGQGAVTVYSDRYPLESIPKEVGLIAHGNPGPNLAITRAARFIDDDSVDGEETVLLTVTNYSTRNKQSTLRLEAEGQALESRDFELGPGAREQFKFKLPGSSPRISARLNPDQFPIDDEAILCPAPRRELRLAGNLDEGEARFLGLEEDEQQPFGQWLALVPRSSLASTPEEAHLTLAHDPSGGPGNWCLSMHAPGSERLDLIGPFLIEKRHPLLEGLSLGGVVWSTSKEAVLPGTPLISAGNIPILTEQLLPTRRVYHMNIDWSRSSLQRTPDWPILLDNLARLRRRELPGALSNTLAIGEDFHFQADGEASYVLDGPDGRRELRAMGPLVIAGLNTVGLYSLSQDGRPLDEFAVHFGDDSESDLRTSSRGERLSAVELARQESGSSWVVLLLGLLALGALLMDWWFLRARSSRGLDRLPTGGKA
jgi:hypothetical protein